MAVSKRGSPLPEGNGASSSQHLSNLPGVLDVGSMRSERDTSKAPADFLLQVPGGMKKTLLLLATMRVEPLRIAGTGVPRL